MDLTRDPSSPSPPDTRPDSARGELQSLVRGIRILELFTEDDIESLRVSDVEEELRIPSSTAYRLVRVLKQSGLLEDGTARGSFQLGPKLRLLADRLPSEDPMLGQLQPLLEQLRGETNETVLLTVRRGDEVVHVEVLNSDEEVRVFIPRGRRMHIAAGGSGRVILAYLRPREIDRILAGPLTAYTAQTVTDPAQIQAELEQIRASGYAISEGQTTADARGICVPLLDDRGAPIASITITGPSYRMNGERVLACLGIMQRAVSRFRSEMA